MQEKKFDVNQLIGISLIFILLAGFMYLNQPSEQELAQREQEQKTQELAEQKSNEVAATVQIKPIQNQLFGTADSVQANIPKTVSLTSEKFNVKINTLGGQISELGLKEYTAYDADSTHASRRKPLYLIQNQNSNFGFSFTDLTGAKINTGQLQFTPQTTTDGSLILTAGKGAGKIQFIYTATDSYTIDFKVRSQGFSQLSNDQRLGVNWSLDAFSLEKGKTQEMAYTDTHYRLKADEDIDYDSGEWDESESIDWVAFKQQFFSSNLYFKQGFNNASGDHKTYELDHPTYLKNFSFQAEVDKTTPELQLDFQWDFVPLDYDLLQSYEAKDYASNIPFGIWGGGGLIGWLNKNFFLPVFQWLSSHGMAAGWVIFFLTIVVKLIMSPVMYRQFRQSAMMKVLRPELDEISAKFKDKDPMKKQQETMALYRKAGVNPLAGCLPALLQMPLFYALFRFFPNLFELRGKSFLWADDLTSYDSIVQLPFTIPMIGNHISLFALLYVVVMVIYFRVSGSLSNFQAPKQEGMPDMSFMKYMMYIMPIFFFVFLNSYASGLSLYYLVSNGINIGIVLFIKNILLDDEKIHAKIQANKAKKPKKQSRWQKKMSDMMAQAQEAQEVRKSTKKSKK